jgi:anthranilate synthase
LVDLFRYDSDESGDLQLGLYGAFGYDLTFQFEPINLAQPRDPNQRDLLLYLADEIVVVDQSRNSAWTVSLDFSYGTKSTKGLPHEGSSSEFQPFDENSPTGAKFSPRDTPQGDFTESVDNAKHEFKVGNLFEVVLSQTFRKPLGKETSPSSLFRSLRSRNPSPYGFFFNLGENEYLVGASPEMFVRCEKVENNEYRPGAIRVETCPISGTVARGMDALEDAARVKSLIMNLKEESELTMCTDVDRNDKSRICEPGSVKVIGRRQIEMYSRLIHTVDHVEGYLRPEFDALDAFLCHTWAVTVTGAPKTWAIQFVEDNERSPRCWYGGAVGLVGFDGSMNTGLTLRTIRVKDGVAEVRAGATLLYDSDAKAEELETELKASAMLDAIDATIESAEIDGDTKMDTTAVLGPGKGKNIILVDHEDSFVHTLGNYLRQTGAEVTTLRSGPSALRTIQKLVDDGKKPDMVVLSPGPGNPTDFELSKTISLLEKNRIPGFGVCLGLQGMVEHFGGELGVLSYPMHGKPSPITLTESGQSCDR